jgi:hypothetical protein
MIGARGNPMPKKKRRDTQEKQSRRFVETARALEADESGKAFERALKVIVPPLKAKKRKAASP